MASKYDDPPAYSGPPQAPQPSYQQHGGYPPQQQVGFYGPPQQGGYYQPNPNMGYYPPQQQQQQGPYGPPQGGGYYGQPGYYPQGRYQDSSSMGCLEGMLAALACCCCLDLLF
ncbi:hypothetical protein BX600DRAFT_428889 [Xylariales sp. PMI_506]|nr:hypothetical protein BX600DRAFT_428889 [Xylariales sp. PMI_506]